MISASITTAEEPQLLQIGLTAFTTRLPIPVENAVAYLFDNRGTRIPYNNLGNGKYELQERFVGEPNVQYIIEVTLADGRAYRSTPQKMPETNVPLKSKFKFGYEELIDVDGIPIRKPLIEILTDVDLPTAPVYLRWTMEEVYIRNPTDFPDPFNTIPPPCFIWNEVDPQNILLFNGKENSAKKLTDFLIGKRLIDPTFLEKHYIVVKQHSINFDAYEYWRKVNVLVNQTGSIFDTPPAELKGNFVCITDPRETVYGYFEVQNTTVDRFYTLPSDIPLYIEPFCQYSQEKGAHLYAKECLDCLTLPNSSHTKPPWF